MKYPSLIIKLNMSTQQPIQSNMCWSTAPEHDTWPGVADIPSATPLKKTGK